MAVTDELEQARAALQMINPAPYNAEAPPEALAGEITPTELHYVRSNFAAAGTRRHARGRRRRREPDHPDARRPARHAGARAGGHARMRRATGGSRCDRCRPASHGATTPSRPPAGPAPSCTRCSRRRSPAADGVDVRFEGADHGAYHLQPVLAETNRDDLALRPRPAARPRRRSGGRDPDRLRDERRAAGRRPRSAVPAHRAPLVRRRVGEVAEAHRRPDRAVRRRVPDRPLHLRVARPAARGGQPHARPRAHHRPRLRRDHQPPAPTRCAARPGRGPGRSRRSRSASPAKASGTPAQLEPPKGPYQWQDWSFDWEATDVGTAHPPRPGDRRGRQRATRGPALEPARLRQQRHRGLLRRRELKRYHPPRREPRANSQGGRQWCSQRTTRSWMSSGR